MSEIQDWNESPAALLQNRGLKFEDPAARARARAEAQREDRAAWEQAMDAADRELAAQGRLTRTWREARMDEEQRVRDSGRCFIDPSRSYVSFIPSNWVTIEGPLVHPQLAGLEAAKVFAKTRQASMNPADPSYQQMVREHEQQVAEAQALRREISGPDVNESLPPSSRVY